MAPAFADDDGDERVPDLSRIPRERWLEALRPLSRYERIVARDSLTNQAEVSIVLSLIGQLALEDGEARARAIAAPAPRVPLGDPPPIELPRRQVNFRLGDGEHARLLEAARLFGMRPNMLARLLTVRGVDRALTEARSDR